MSAQPSKVFGGKRKSSERRLMNVGEQGHEPVGMQLEVNRPGVVAQLDLHDQIYAIGSRL